MHSLIKYTTGVRASICLHWFKSYGNFDERGNLPSSGVSLGRSVPAACTADRQTDLQTDRQTDQQGGGQADQQT